MGGVRLRVGFKSLLHPPDLALFCKGAEPPQLWNNVIGCSLA